MNEVITTKEKIIIGLLYLFALFSHNEAINSVMLYTTVPLAFLLSFSIKPKFPHNRTFKGIVVLYIWAAITAVFALDINNALNELKMSLGTFMMVLIMFRIARTKKILPWLYGVWVIYYFEMLQYAWNLFITGQFVFGEQRLQSETFNPNGIGYITFFLTFLLFVMPYLLTRAVFVKISRILFLLMVPWSFFVAILAGSRQILIVQIPLLLSLLYLRYITIGGMLRKQSGRVIFVVLLCFFTYFVVDRVSDIYNNSVLHARSERSVEDDERTILFKDALNVGLEHPIFGVGPGNYGKISVLNLYSHNSYTEIFANSGILALLIYIYIMLSFVLKQVKRYRQTRDPSMLMFVIFGVIYVVDNFFDVFYIGIWLLSFYMLVVNHSELHYLEIVRTKTIEK